MKLGMKYWRSSIVAVGILVALTGATVALAANPNPGVLPPRSHPYGHTYGEWSNAWWQWAFSVQTDVNPLLDTTGANCSEGQSGPVWFLGGTLFNSGSVTRNCTIPAGKALFFPIANDIEINTGDLCGPDRPVPDLRQALNTFIASVTTLEAQVDGTDIQNLRSYRAGSDNPTFSITVPQENVTSIICTPPLPAGTYGPGVSDGYYLMLAPLPVGSHTIHFKGATNTGFTTEATYHLTVK